MPQIANLPLFSIKSKGTYLGVTVRNVWHYIDLAGAPTTAADVLASSFITSIITPAQTNVSNQFTIDEVEVIQENDSENFALVTAGIVGGSIDPPVASAQAISIRLNRTDRLFRNGWKRWAGLTEVQTEGNFMTVASQTAFQTNFAPMGNTLASGGNTFTPVILRKTYVGEPPVLNPVSQWIYATIGSAQVFRRLGTQNTRKPTEGE